MQAIDVAGGFSGEEALARAVDAVLHLFRAHEAAASHHALHAAALLPTGGTTRRTRSCTVKHTHKDAAALVSPLTASLSTRNILLAPGFLRRETVTAAV